MQQTLSSPPLQRTQVWATHQETASRYFFGYLRKAAVVCVSVIGLIQLSSQAAFSRQQFLLNDERVLVTQVEISPVKPYILPTSDAGIVWVALDPVILITSKDGLQTKKRIRAGDAEIFNSGGELQFLSEGASHGHLIVIKPKTTHQELTVSPFLLNNSIEDASDRNATLLVAISKCRFRDTWNLGDESEWIPSRPAIVVMNAGSVRWIPSGIHHFKNLGQTAPKLVSIEW